MCYQCLLKIKIMVMDSLVLSQTVPDYLNQMFQAMKGRRRKIQKCHGCFLKVNGRTPKFWEKVCTVGLVRQLQSTTGACYSKSLVYWWIATQSTSVEEPVWTFMALVRKQDQELRSIV